MNDDVIDQLLGALDARAREYDGYDYGLPIHDPLDEVMIDLRGIVRNWLERQASISSER